MPADIGICTGLFIVGISIIVFFVLYAGVVFLLQAQSKVQNTLFNKEMSVLATIVVFLVWVILSAFKLCMLLIGIICAISLANDARSWWHKR